MTLATQGRWAADDLASARTRKDVPEEKQAVYAPAFSRKDGKYVPDRTVDDNAMIKCPTCGKVPTRVRIKH